MHKAPELKPWGYFVFVLLLGTLLSLSPGSGQGAGQHFAWLPLAIKPWVNTNPIHTGIATPYHADGDGSCMFGTSPDDLMVTALNEVEWNDAAWCGAYVHVAGPLGEATVRIVDMCPGCQAGHLDMSVEAFQLIGSLGQGRVDITWQVISPDLQGPIAYHFMESSSQWWTAVQVRNHRNPVAKFEYVDEYGQWVTVPRTDYNFFIQYDPGMGPGPYTFRVTDWYGNVLTDSGIVFIEGGTVEGQGQFPQGP